MRSGLHNVYSETSIRLAECQVDGILLSARDLRRYWAKVPSSGGADACWLWQASRLGDYGQFVATKPGALTSRGKDQAHLYAHRVAWVIANGRPIPDGLMVLHRCDVPMCVNPAHLFLGTQLDNMRDCKAKGRLRPHGRPQQSVRRAS